MANRTKIVPVIAFLAGLFTHVQINAHLLERHQMVLLTLYSSGIYVPEVTYSLLRSATVVVVEPFSGNVPFLVSVRLLIGQ